MCAFCQKIAQVHEDNAAKIHKKAAAERSIVRLQARCRGYLVRKRLADRKQHFRNNERLIKIIQVLLKLYLK